MPTHVYVGLRRPPTRFDHLLAHPYELALAVYGIVGGILAIASAFNEGMSVSASMDQLPALAAAAAGLLLLVGGGGILHGLFDNSDDLGIGFTRERMGLALQTAGWGVYAVTIAWLSISSVLSWGLCVALILANVLRFIATTRQERNLRADVKQGLGG